MDSGGEFSAETGTRRGAAAGTLNTLLRPAVYATAPRQPVWLPRVSSTLFPRMPSVALRPFRLALIGVLAAVLVLVNVPVSGPLGVLSVIGWPLLFLIYVWQSDAFRDIPIRILAVAAVLGVALGVGWWLAAAKIVAGSYGVSTGAGQALLGDALNVGLLVSLGGGVMMLIPAFVTRLFPVPDRESLDGFVVGAFGALWCSTAASTTILAPQFAEGLMTQRSPGRLLEDSITYGIVNAVVTTAAGGLVGLALWFTPRDGSGRARRAVIGCAVLGALSYAALWWVDSLGVSRVVDLAGKTVVAVLALLAVRAGVQIALLHERPDPARDTPILCVHCATVVPDAPFCVSCGAAGRASSRTSRRRRREHPPVLVSGPD